jgi:hypothetical protein
MPVRNPNVFIVHPDARNVPPLSGIFDISFSRKRDRKKSRFFYLRRHISFQIYFILIIENVKIILNV